MELTLDNIYKLKATAQKLWDIQCDCGLQVCKTVIKENPNASLEDLLNILRKRGSYCYSK